MLSGDPSTDYTVTVTGTDVDGNTIVETFIITIKNPCRDMTRIDYPSSVEMPELSSYYLWESNPDGMEIASFSLLQISIPNDSNNLCMTDLTYEITLDGADVTETSTPVWWIQNDQDDV